MSEDDLLAAAKKRGMGYAIAAFTSSDNLTEDEADLYTRQYLECWTDSGLYYRLRLPDVTDAVKYPRWQFDVDEKRLLAAMKELHSNKVENCYVIHFFFVMDNADLDWMSPAEYIADDSKPIERLLQLINRRFGEMP